MCLLSHCSYNPSGFIVYLGRQSQEGSNPNKVSRTISQIIMHPGYNSDTLDNDIVLLRLSSPVDFNDYIRPVCLAASGSTFSPGANVWFTGWGNIEEGGLEFLPPVVWQEAEIPVLEQSTCGNIYYCTEITDNMLCAGQEGKGTREGGVVSFGDVSSYALYPDVYARVSRYQSWITSHITTDTPGFITVTTGNDQTT
ncbi:transmembrane protease serine 9-like [Engraulis encrasicolus]|uniref:transmembrane protease serine 9-like n=1 Tax=Engraulis encrasicolus TaxID=184585 RepID=UPI002FD6C908